MPSDNLTKEQLYARLAKIDGEKLPSKTVVSGFLQNEDFIYILAHLYTQAQEGFSSVGKMELTNQENIAQAVRKQGEARGRLAAIETIINFATEK